MNDETQAVFEGTAGLLRLAVEGYQFPNNEDDEWDSNWLIIVGEAALNGKPWRFRDPCLTTFEMQRLAEWLEQVADGRAEQQFCGFTEPNLDFEQISEQSIRIAFSLETLPPWSARDADFGDVGFDVPIDSRLAAAASNLHRLLTYYPIRARK